MKLWLALILVMLLSYFANGLNPQTAPSGDGALIPAAWTPLVYTVNAVFILAIGTLVAGCPDRRLLRSIAGLFCILSAPFLLYVDFTGERVWGRLTANELPGGSLASPGNGALPEAVRRDEDANAGRRSIFAGTLTGRAPRFRPC